MRYLETFQLLRSKVNYDVGTFSLFIQDLNRNYSFVSNNVDILPGERHYNCLLHRYESDDTSAYHYDAGITTRRSTYTIRRCAKTASSVIMSSRQREPQKVLIFSFLLHGFNEKNWAKYLPWAKQIVVSDREKR